MPILRSGALRRALWCLALPVALGACALTFDARSLGVPAAMSAEAPVAGDSFHVTQTAVHLFWGTYQVRSVSLQAVLANQLGDGRSVANLRIRVARRWSDLLVTALTAGLVAPTAVTVEGVITRPGR